MNKYSLRTFGVVVVAAGALAGSNAFASIVDLSTAGASGSIGDAFFQQTHPQPTGTGFIDPFLRLQANNHEAGYNTSAQGAVFNDKTGIWTHDLLLSSLKVVDHNGTPSYQFLLDINESSNGNNKFLSLNQLQIFVSGTGNHTEGSVSSTTGYLTGLSGVTSVYDMNPGGGTANGVKLNYALNSGSGSGDMWLYIPVADFGSEKYVILYSQFGNHPGQFTSNAGFEEWAAVVPEPATIIAGALLLLPFGASTLRILRQKQTA